MVTEDYVSFEIAKLLKEKGFNELCHKAYHYYGYALSYHHKAKDFNGEEYSKLNTEWYSAPTLQMAMKHVREFGWYIDIRRNNNNFTYFYYIYNRVGKMVAFSNADYPTYEKASDEALRHIYTYLIQDL